MDPKLLDIRRYAIDNRVEIRFVDPASGRECVIDSKGKLKVVGEDKCIRIEDAFAGAQVFEVVEAGRSLRHTRDAMADAVNEAFKRRGFASSVKEEE
jgi:hypothetical protein